MDFETIKNYGKLGFRACKIVQALEAVSTGEVISDYDLATIAGGDCRPGEQFYGTLLAAIRYCETPGIAKIFQREKNTGYKCLSASESLDNVKHYLKTIKRKTTRAMRKTTTIDESKLSEPEVKRLNNMVNQVAVISMFTTESTAKRIAENVVEKVDAKDVLKMFTS